ncbi:hypothetical protein HPB49_002814 [Dermacentor silvarum]|uniref:Uncharacterized protein n=1 Tax=Dermacentor silvarum TaxID=543639 RepID=A0ACB8DM44_DERSI|nr:hypothetical protein HPB49_002814 [Dermacentor silvarum]
MGRAPNASNLTDSFEDVHRKEAERGGPCNGSPQRTEDEDEELNSFPNLQESGHRGHSVTGSPSWSKPRWNSGINRDHCPDIGHCVHSGSNKVVNKRGRIGPHPLGLCWQRANRNRIRRHQPVHAAARLDIGPTFALIRRPADAGLVVRQIYKRTTSVNPVASFAGALISRGPSSATKNIGEEVLELEPGGNPSMEKPVSNINPRNL